MFAYALHFKYLDYNLIILQKYFHYYNKEIIERYKAVTCTGFCLGFRFPKIDTTHSRELKRSLVGLSFRGYNINI